MNLRQSKEFAKYMELCSWQVEKVGKNYAYLRQISFLPPLILKIPYPTPPISLARIEKIAQKHKPFSIQIQPLKYEAGLEKYGYHLSQSPGHVTKTIHLDLTLPEEKILAQMKKDARYEIRKAKEIEIELLSNQAIKKFHQAWKKSVSWNRWVPSQKSLKMLKKAFGKNAIFLVATPFRISYIDISYKDILAGTVILIAGKTAYYYYAFTSKQGREKAAQYFLVWEAIKLAKKLGCKIFDFEGIYDERFPIKSWKGFSHFKKSFGGKEIEYPGCFVKYRFPFLAPGLT